eukprot:TRINITY_DN9422_c0_g1_i1.p1 TRINITY_DN9422_c0_g1~~TRINITY_DN9422_c0_g1_i1.p1  ORF type:complete len:259 (-),score=51.88 TRINITY_DN9422_c0_g1_i1:69-845(-)
MRLFLFALFVGACVADVMMEITFNHHPGVVSTYGKNFDSKNFIAALLTSPDLKWIRFHCPLVSGDPVEVPQSVAQFVFRNFEAWTSFEQSNHATMKSLYDHFWVDTYRKIYSIEPDVGFHKVQRAEGNLGGYLWELRYSVKEGQQAALDAHVKSFKSAFVNELKMSRGFFERTLLKDQFLHSEFSNVEIYDFKDLASMNSVMKGTAYETLFNGMKRFLSNYAVTIMTPGQTDGHFWKGLDDDDDEVFHRDRPLMGYYK